MLHDVDTERLRALEFRAYAIGEGVPEQASATQAGGPGAARGLGLPGERRLGALRRRRGRDRLSRAHARAARPPGRSRSTARSSRSTVSTNSRSSARSRASRAGPSPSSSRLSRNTRSSRPSSPASGAPARSHRWRSCARCASAASPSRTHRSTTRTRSTARTYAWATRSWSSAPAT